jgi:hypothetical protein
MQNIATKLLATILATVHTPKDDERGQGTIEYLGAIIVAVVIILATIKAVGGADIGGEIIKQIQKVITAGG